MSERIIPEHIDPFRYAEQSLRIEGVVNLAEMPRLSMNLAAADSSVSVQLQFGVDEQQIANLKGHIDATLVLQCQRCMEPFNYGIISDFALGIVNTLDEANALPEHYEPALAVEGSLALRELIEDELILNLPIIPRHELDQCKVVLPLAGTAEEQGQGENPFHVLKSLKQKQR